jgi:hypothetical protein
MGAKQLPASGDWTLGLGLRATLIEGNSVCSGKGSGLDFA